MGAVRLLEGTHERSACRAALPVCRICDGKVASAFCMAAGWRTVSGDDANYVYSKALRLRKRRLNTLEWWRRPPNGQSFLPAPADWAGRDDMDMLDPSWRIVVTVLHLTGGLGPEAARPLMRMIT